MIKLESAQYVLEDDGDKAQIYLEQYKDGVHITIQNREKTICLSAKQSEGLRRIVLDGLLYQNQEEPEVEHTHNQFGGMIDCKGCNK